MKKPSSKKKKPSVQLASPRDFFASELRSVMEKRRIEAKQDSFDYLVELLLRFIESDTLFAKNAEGKPSDPFLAGLYAEYIQGTPETQKLTLRRLGDICLMVTGFFPDSLNRKLVDVDYYTGMGGAAYWTLAQGQKVADPFHELSVKFRIFSDVLGELSEKSGLQTNQDLLRVYERWIYTGSDRLKGVLAEKGIPTPLRVETKIRH